MADEHVRRAQEELRKRHLFFGETTGEVTPALTTALNLYQKKKGFAPTGRLDPETCASLGLMKVSAQWPQTPFVVADAGNLRGANGEVLPAFLMFSHPAADSAATGIPPLALTLAEDDPAPVAQEKSASNGRARGRPRRIQPRKETNPLVLVFQSVDHAMKFLVGDTPPKRKRASANRL